MVKTAHAKPTQLRQYRPSTLVCGALLSIGLAGCSALGGGGAVLDTYDFTAPSNLDAVRGRTSAQILVPVPTALKVLDSDRLVIRTSGTAVTYMPDARIGDQLPKVIQSKLAETLENTNRIRAVGKPGQGLLIDYQLITDIRAFEVRTATNSFIAFGEISAKLVDDRNGRVRAQRVFRARVPSTSSNSPDLVTALDAVFDKIATDMTGWILQAV